MEQIKEASTLDVDYTKLRSELQSSKVNLNGTDFKVDQIGLLWFKYRLYMPKNLEITIFSVNDMHKILFAGHPNYQKMITNLRKQLFCLGLNFDLLKYLSKCLEFQQVKT